MADVVIRDRNCHEFFEVLIFQYALIRSFEKDMDRNLRMYLIQKSWNLENEKTSV